MFNNVCGATSEAVLISAPTGQSINSKAQPAMTAPKPLVALAENATAAKKSTFLAATGLVFMLITNIRHHRAITNIGLRR